ncbi:MAG: carbonic anhydrase [Myxococcota bacterium]
MLHLFHGLLSATEGMDPRLKAHFQSLAHQQNPELLLIACSDSRFEQVLGARPGQVFVVRSVGNIIAPADETGHSVGDVSEASAIEYGLEVLGIRDIAVCGHSNCGAMGAVLKGRHTLKATAPNLVTWLAHAEPSLQRLARTRLNFPPELSEADRLSQENVLLQLEHVATFHPVKRRAGEVKLHALWFDIGRAMMHLYEADKGRFVPLDEAEVLRLLTPAVGTPSASR